MFCLLLLFSIHFYWVYILLNGIILSFLNSDFVLDILKKLKIALLLPYDYKIYVYCKTFRQYRNHNEENKNHLELYHPKIIDNIDLFSSRVFFCGTLVTQSPPASSAYGFMWSLLKMDTFSGFMRDLHCYLSLSNCHFWVYLK